MSKRAHRKHSRRHRSSPVWWIVLLVTFGLIAVVALMIYVVSQF